MSLFVASETESFPEAFFSLLWGKFLDFYSVNVHGIGVLGHSWRGEGLEGLGSPSASLGDLLCTAPLILEMDHFRVLVINLFWYSIERHDSFHEQGRDSGHEETD